MKKIIVLLLILLMFSCVSEPEIAEEEVEIIEFTYELEEMEPLPEKIVKVVEVPKEYEYIVSSVAEVEEIDGVQKYFYIKLGYSKQGIVRNLNGKIFNDMDQKEQIGTFKLVEVFKSFSKAQITELNFKLNSSATVLFEIEKKD